MDCHQKYGIVSVNLDSFCRDRLCRVRQFQKRENHRAGTERTGIVRFVRLLQLSAAGEVFLEGTCPLSRRPQTAKSPAPCFWRTEKGTKSGSFLRGANKTAPRVKPERKSKIFARSRWDVANEVSGSTENSLQFRSTLCRDTACRVRRFHITKHSEKQASPERGGGPPIGGGEVFREIFS